MPHSSHRSTRILHPMESFGNIAGLTEGIRINRLEKRLAPLIPFPHKHDFYQILLVRQGRGTHEIDFQNYRIPKHRLFVMRPAEVHTWNLSPDTSGFVLEFNVSSIASKDPRWQSLRGMLERCPRAPEISPQSFRDLLQLAEGALREYEKAAPHFELLVLADLLRFLVLLSRSIVGLASELGSESELQENFAEALEQNFRQEHSVSFYADALGLTPKALTMRFARLGLKPPRDQIQERCLLEARRLLAYSKLSIQDISDSLGFEDPNYFARLFRKKIGQTPGAFRRQSGHLC